MQFVGETTGQSGIHHQELLHLILIASHDDHELTSVVLHTLHQGVDSLLAVLIILVRQRIGLVNEEDTTHCLVAHSVDNLGRLTHIFSYQRSTTGFDNIRRRQYLHGLEHLTHLTGDRRLTRTGITGQDEVHRHLLNVTGTHSCTLLDKHALHSQSADSILDGTHTNEVVELVEHLVERTGR